MMKIDTFRMSGSILEVDYIAILLVIIIMICTFHLDKRDRLGWLERRRRSLNKVKVSFKPEETISIVMDWTMFWVFDIFWHPKGHISVVRGRCWLFGWGRIIRFILIYSLHLCTSKLQQMRCVFSLERLNLLSCSFLMWSWNNKSSRWWMRIRFS